MSLPPLEQYVAMGTSVCLQLGIHCPTLPRSTELFEMH